MPSSERTEEEWSAFQFSCAMGAPVIGTFEPEFGDIARDRDAVGTRLRVWYGKEYGWRPSFDVIPLGE